MLATYPIGEGVSGARDLLNIVFVLVVLFTPLQGPSLPVAACRLGLARPGAVRDVQVETAPLDVLDADLLTLTIPPGSRLTGVAVFELRLPPPTVLTLIVRAGATIVPRPESVLRTGDELLRTMPNLGFRKATSAGSPAPRASRHPVPRGVTASVRR